MKLEVGRILNRVVELYLPAKIVVEDLKHFLKSVINQFHKAVKRVLIRFGLREIKQKLKELQEEYGIEIVYVNPAYSSQACSSCGYTDKENRKSRSDFECRLCGKNFTLM